MDYYSRVSSELGLRFVKEVESAIARARQFPEAWTPPPSNLRRVRPRRFPHSVVYEVMPNGLFIWAVAHASHRSGCWRELLAA